MKDYNIYCDSGDLVLHLMRHHPSQIVISFNNSSNYKFVAQNYTLNFFLEKTKFPEIIKKEITDKTYGTMDYILTDENNTEILLALEDTYTAPLGNSLIQRMDKVFPLFIMDGRSFPLVYIAPLEGADVSQSVIRSAKQSWFYKSLLEKYPNSFLFLEKKDLQNKSVCDHTFDLIEKYILSSIKIETPSVVDLKMCLNSMVESVRTIKSDKNSLVFSGKIFKPSNSWAHPVCSTAMLMIMLNDKVEAYDDLILQVSKEHSELLDKRKTSNRKANFLKNNLTRRIVL